jgi:uncharacterized oligopeptide transporter (OPT) family protein
MNIIGIMQYGVIARPIVAVKVIFLHSLQSVIFSILQPGLENMLSKTDRQDKSKIRSRQLADLNQMWIVMTTSHITSTLQSVVYHILSPPKTRND